MASLAVWLMALVTPLVKKVLLALGIGWLSYSAFNALAGQITAAVQAAFGQMGGASLQILTIGGILEAVGITLGAITARAALMAVDRMGKIAS